VGVHAAGRHGRPGRGRRGITCTFGGQDSRRQHGLGPQRIQRTEAGTFRGLHRSTHRQWLHLSRALMCGPRRNLGGGVRSAGFGGFVQPLEKQSETALWSVVTHFRPFLNFTKRVDLLNALKMAGVRRHHGIVPLLDNDEELAVVQGCTCGTTSARDAAITLTLATSLEPSRLCTCAVDHERRSLFPACILVLGVSTPCPGCDRLDVSSIASPPSKEGVFCVRSKHQSRPR
jgi:hypothetical protein